MEDCLFKMIESEIDINKSIHNIIVDIDIVEFLERGNFELT